MTITVSNYFAHYVTQTDQFESAQAEELSLIRILFREGEILYERPQAADDQLTIQNIIESEHLQLAASPAMVCVDIY